MDFSLLTPKIVIEFLLRWFHILAGVTWVGFLYWLNLVNVDFQKALDAEIKPKVNPILIPKTLFYFRWSALITFLTGFLYYVSILHGEVQSGPLKPLLVWLLIVAVSYFIIFKLIRPEGALNNGNVLALLVTAVVVVSSTTLYAIYKHLGVVNNSSYAIGVGGMLGTFMMLNVWGIIWPAQKRLLGLVALKEGQDKLKFARRAFLASRTNAWLSIPMLFFMAVSSPAFRL